MTYVPVLTYQSGIHCIDSLFRFKYKMPYDLSTSKSNYHHKYLMNIFTAMSCIGENSNRPPNFVSSHQPPVIHLNATKCETVFGF